MASARLPGSATVAEPHVTAESQEKQRRAEALLNDSSSEDWYGLYLMDEKVGHARVWTRSSQPSEPGALATGAETWMKVKGPGGDVEISLLETRFYAKKSPHRLIASAFEQLTPLGRDRRFAQMTDEGVTITRSDGSPAGRTYKVPHTVETIERLSVMNPNRVDDLQVGEIHNVLSFDWQTERDEEVKVEVVGVEDIRWAGVQTRVAVLELTYPRIGLSGTSRVVDGGVMLDTTMGPGLRLKLEERHVAQSGIRGFDVMGVKVPLVGVFPGGGGLEEVNLRVSVGEKVQLPKGPGQNVRRLGDGKWRVRLSTRASRLPATEAERHDALLVQGAIDHDVPQIKKAAKEIVGAEEKVAGRVQRLVTWVYEKLDKKVATHIPTASAVLKARVGDCTEHTWLFVALCRALNIPARPVYGLMLAGAEQAYYLYHAWAEVELDGHWMAVDPTWNQVPADLTHLKLGSEFYELAAILGGIQMEVVNEEASSRQ